MPSLLFLAVAINVYSKLLMVGLLLAGFMQVVQPVSLLAIHCRAFVKSRSKKVLLKTKKRRGDIVYDSLTSVL